jgi:MoaA/NifB/PqqE/SkfB family radical SAM enzyme
MCNRSFNREEDKLAQGFLSWDVFNKTIPFWPYARVLFGGFGEALMHPNYLEMLQKLKKSGAYVYTYSNGILLTETIARGFADTGMDKIYISMGGSTRETYHHVRGVDAFDTVVKNLKYLNDYKKEKGTSYPHVAFNVVAMTSVMPELVGILELAKELGAEEVSMPNLVVQGDSILHESVWLDQKTNKEIFDHAGRKAEQLKITFHPPVMDEREGLCWDLFSRLNVNWDGSVMSCAMERFILGDLHSQTIKQIWNSAGIKKLRGGFLQGKAVDLCPNCACRKLSKDNLLNPWANSRREADKV